MLTLVVGKTCQNCNFLKKRLEGQIVIEHQTIVAEDNMDYCRAKGIKSVPALVLDGFESEVQVLYTIDDIYEALVLEC